MSQQVMTFRELVKRIHPDKNPNIQDAGEKMRTATIHRNDPSALYRLAVTWGLLPTPTRPRIPKPRPTQTRVRPSTRNTDTWTAPQERWEWRAFYHDEPRVGDYVCVVTREGKRVQVDRLTAKRVYFYVNGQRSFASKNNVYVVRKVRVS